MAGVSLDESGRQQADRLGARLSERPLVAVVSSPLERARETAAAIADRAGLAVEIEPGLNEIDFGAWTGRPFADLEGDPAWSHWNRSRGLGQCPGGETMLTAQARAVAAVRAQAARFASGEIVLVGHQDVLKSVLAQWLGMPLDLLHRVAWDPAHGCTAAWGGGGPVVQGVNWPP